jgi:hypothetical protein
MQATCFHHYWSISLQIMQHHDIFIFSKSQNVFTVFLSKLNEVDDVNKASETVCALK